MRYGDFSQVDCLGQGLPRAAALHWDLSCLGERLLARLPCPTPHPLECYPMQLVKTSGKELVGECRLALWQGLLGILICHASTQAPINTSSLKRCLGFLHPCLTSSAVCQGWEQPVCHFPIAPIGFGASSAPRWLVGVVPKKQWCFVTTF